MARWAHRGESAVSAGDPANRRDLAVVFDPGDQEDLGELVAEHWLRRASVRPVAEKSTRSSNGDSVKTDVVNLADKFNLFDDRWSPKIAARINNLDLKLVKAEGIFVWHRHAETDEFFLVHRGQLTIELRDRRVVLGPGECFVVPRGVEHRPKADQTCDVVILEPVGTVNTGDAGGDLTSAEDPWV